MKNKNVILSAAVVLAAVVGAFATANSLAAAAFVHVRFAGQSNFTCINSGNLCSDSGSATCLVTIPDLSTTTPAYTQASVCTVTLKNSSATPVGDYNPVPVIEEADQ